MQVIYIQPLIPYSIQLYQMYTNYQTNKTTKKEIVDYLTMSCDYMILCKIELFSIKELIERNNIYNKLF